MNRLNVLVCVCACVCARAWAGTPVRVDDCFLNALCQVESGGKNVVGDKGKAIGVMQIHKSYWQDAIQFDPSIGGSYSDCLNSPTYSRKIVVAYLTRYASQNATYEELARIHNGGCKIMHKKKTTAWNNTTNYWIKIKKEMDKTK